MVAPGSAKDGGVNIYTPTEVLLTRENVGCATQPM
jgi:hypothetical protein